MRLKFNPIFVHIFLLMVVRNQFFTLMLGRIRTSDQKTHKTKEQHGHLNQISNECNAVVSFEWLSYNA